MAIHCNRAAHVCSHTGSGSRATQRGYLDEPGDVKLRRRRYWQLCYSNTRHGQKAKKQEGVKTERFVSGLTFHDSLHLTLTWPVFKFHVPGLATGRTF